MGRDFDSEKYAKNAYFNVQQRFPEFDWKGYDELNPAEKKLVVSIWEQGWYFGALGSSKPKANARLS